MRGGFGALAYGIGWLSGTPPGEALSTIVTGSRTAAAGAGVQSITGAGFVPRAAIAIGSGTSGSALVASWGLLDDASAERVCLLSVTLVTDAANLIHISDGVNAMTAVAVLTADGLDLTWSKGAAGIDAIFSILFLA